MNRISQNGQGPIVDVDQVKAIEPSIRSNEPGRYQIDEISADPLPSGHTSRRWAVLPLQNRMALFPMRPSNGIARFTEGT